MNTPHEKTPGEQTGGIPNNHHSRSEDDALSIADRGEFFAQHLNGIYIVVAQIKSPEDSARYRRRFYANLPSAQRAVDRAVMNGRDAHLFIGQVSIIGGDGLD